MAIAFVYSPSSQFSLDLFLLFHLFVGLVLTALHLAAYFSSKSIRMAKADVQRAQVLAEGWLFNRIRCILLLCDMCWISVGNISSVHKTVTLNCRICSGSWRKGATWMLYAGMSVRVAAKGREVSPICNVGQ